MIYTACIIAFLLLVTCNGAKADSSSKVAQAFIDNKIVPNIVSTAPENLIQVSYSGTEVNLGNRFNPLQTLGQPSLTFDANDDEIYTLAFFGPDLPPDLIPPYTQFLHWLVVNVPDNNLQKGDTVSSYFPPAPYPGGFPYIFVFFKQADRIDPQPLKYLSVILNRPHFEIMKLQSTYNLTGPIAGNFMREVYLPPYSSSSN